MGATLASRGAAAALDHAPGERHGGEPARGRSDEAPGLDLGDEAGELLPLGRIEVAAAPAPRAEELDEPPPLRPAEPGHVRAGEHGDLGDREQLEHRQPPQPGQPGEQVGGEGAPHPTGVARCGPVSSSGLWQPTVSSRNEARDRARDRRGGARGRRAGTGRARGPARRRARAARHGAALRRPHDHALGPPADAREDPGRPAAGGADGEPWVEVRVPMRPNGEHGWVPRSALGRLHVVRTRLVVDRRALTATLRRKGRVVWRSRVGVGAPGTPTPGGSFYIRELIRVPSPHGIYGPYAFGTSAYSVLSDWPGGGVVGIHGTNAPSLIPGRPSHGCIRVPNAAISRLARLMPVGTPLRIR